MQPAHTSLVGRDEALAEIADLIAKHRLVSLVGTGGVGKTRVASELATRLAPSFAGGAWLVELAVRSERDDAVPARSAACSPCRRSTRPTTRSSPSCTGAVLR